MGPAIVVHLRVEGHGRWRSGGGGDANDDDDDRGK